MIDTSKAKWTLNHIEKYAIKWLNENGFSGYVKKQYQSKIIVFIEKDGISAEVDIMNYENVHSQMNLIDTNWKLQKEINELRKQVESLCPCPSHSNI